MLEPDAAPVPERRVQVQRELFLSAISPARPPHAVAIQIAQTLKDVYATQGEVIFRRGDPPRAASFIVSGELAYQGIDGEEDQVFGPGGLVGILDLSIGRPRLRTVVARTDVHLLEMNYEAWLEVLEDHPEFTTATRRAVATSLHEVALQLSPTGGFDELEKSELGESRDSIAAPEADLVSRIGMLRKTRCFEQASVHAIAQIAERGVVLRYQAGDLVFSLGGSLDRIFLVMEGSVVVERRVAPELRATFNAGNIVLSSAAFSSALRSYAMVASKRTTLLALDVNDIDDVADDHFDVVKSVMRGLSIDRDKLQSLRAVSDARSHRPPKMAM